MGPLGRKSLKPIPAGEARARLGLDPSRPTLLVAGGSQGARALNTFAAGLVPGLGAAEGQILALVGEGKGEELREEAQRVGEAAWRAFDRGFATNISGFAHRRARVREIDQSRRT